MSSGNSFQKGAAQAEILVIGLGNDYRCDDGAGRRVARLLREETSPDVRVLDESGEGASLMDSWAGADFVILVDAVHSGSEPGTIHRLDANDGPVPSNFFHYSTHAFSVAEAVELARALNQLPPRLVIYGIEGKRFESGTELSSEVARAIGEVAQRIRKEILTQTKPQ